jgi:hypothetical protein
VAIRAVEEVLAPSFPDTRDVGQRVPTPVATKMRRAASTRPEPRCTLKPESMRTTTSSMISTP